MKVEKSKFERIRPNLVAYMLARIPLSLKVKVKLERKVMYI